MTQSDGKLAAKAIDHIRCLLADSRAADLDSELAAIHGMVDVHARLVALRSVAEAFAQGEISRPLDFQDYLFNRLGDFQTTLLSLISRLEKAERGQYRLPSNPDSGKLSYLANLVDNLENAFESFTQREQETSRLTRMLTHEVETRSAAMRELGASEARFKYLAEHDPLTGILNRRSFFTVAELELIEASKRKESCCLGILDIDRFKSFNDRYGHIEGDAAIRHITRICQNHMRLKDCFGRYGGEEFVFLFSGIDLEKGNLVIDRLRQAVATSPVTIGDESAFLTVSIGFTEICPEQSIADRTKILHTALEVADKALYEAKNSGRNAIFGARITDFSDSKT